MPRSGTSLVEQIAASHRLVHGAGERKDIAGILSTLGGGKMGKLPSTWDPASVRREAAEHVRKLHHLSGGAARVIDKLPLNIVVLGQIAVLFPGARIVVCRRDPRDVSLSCFFQYFQEDAMPWTDSLEDCGFRSQEIDRLMTHWREVLPLPILEIEYEALVGNLEAESRRLIDFLGLDWDPACLSFHKTERTVMTASLWQVRQPLYASSVGRWRHYRRHLGPLLRELKGLVPAEACVRFLSVELALVRPNMSGIDGTRSSGPVTEGGAIVTPVGMEQHCRAHDRLSRTFERGTASGG